MSATGRRPIAPQADREPSGAARLAIVVVCVLLTAGTYVGLIFAVVRGHSQALTRLLPWLAVAALAGCTLFLASALSDVVRRWLRRRRRRLAAERLSRLAAVIGSWRPSQRERALDRLVERLDVACDALRAIANPSVAEALVAGGLADRVEFELVEAKGKWHRVSAAGVLGELGSPGSLDVLKRALADPDPDVAYAAAQALANHSSPTAYHALLDALDGHAIPPARVAGLLDSFRCPTARELIEARALSDDPGMRYWAAYLLGRLGDMRSATVIERLTHDANADVRANAAEALASVPDERALCRLLADESWVVRSRAAKVAGITCQTSLAPRLAELLGDGSWWVRQNATLALAGLGAASVPALLGQLRSPDRFARNKAAEALVRGGYVSSQLEHLDEHGERDGETARQFLIDLGRAEGLAAIEAAARSPSSAQAQDRLLGVLEAIGTRQAASALERLKGDRR
jgi:HEAT repeat protein